MTSPRQRSEVVIRVPEDLGPEVSTEIRVCLWLCGLGQYVREGQRMIELIIGPMTYVVHAPCDGRLTRRSVAEGALVRPGAILGAIESDGRGSSSES